MPAAYQFSETNTVSGTVTDGITNINFGSNDSPNLNVDTYPVVIGLSSFEKYIRVLFSGTWTEISNMLFWKSAGTLVTGETIKAAANVTFATPSQTANGDSNVPTSLATALALNSFEGNPTIEDVSGVSGYTGYIRLQTQSTGSTPAGDGNQKTFTFQYDEI